MLITALSLVSLQQALVASLLALVVAVVCQIYQHIWRPSGIQGASGNARVKCAQQQPLNMAGVCTEKELDAYESKETYALELAGRARCRVGNRPPEAELQPSQDVLHAPSTGRPSLHAYCASPSYEEHSSMDTTPESFLAGICPPTAYASTATTIGSHSPRAATFTLAMSSGDGSQCQLHSLASGSPAPAASIVMTSASSSSSSKPGSMATLENICNGAPFSSSNPESSNGALQLDTVCQPDTTPASPAYDLARMLVNNTRAQTYTPMFTLGRVALKIPDHHPSDLPATATWTQPYCEALQSQGVALIGAYVRQGCIHIVLDFLDLAVDCNMNTNNRHSTNCSILANRGSNGNSHGNSMSLVAHRCAHTFGGSSSGSSVGGSNSRRRFGRSTAAATEGAGLSSPSAARVSAPGDLLPLTALSRDLHAHQHHQHHQQQPLQLSRRHAMICVRSASAAAVRVEPTTRDAPAGRDGDVAGTPNDGRDNEDNGDGPGGTTSTALGRLVRPWSTRRARQLRQASASELLSGHNTSIRSVPRMLQCSAAPQSPAARDCAAAGNGTAPPQSVAVPSPRLHSVLTPELLIQALGPGIGGGGQMMTVQLPGGGGTWNVQTRLQSSEGGGGATTVVTSSAAPPPPTPTCISPSCVLSGAPGPILLYVVGVDLRHVAGNPATTEEVAAAAASGGSGGGAGEGLLSVHVRFRGDYLPCCASLLGDQMPADPLTQVLPLDDLHRAQVLCLQLAAAPTQPGLMFVECQRGALLGPALPVLVAPNTGIWQEVAALQDAAVQEGGHRLVAAQHLVLELGLWLEYLSNNSFTSSTMLPLHLSEQQKHSGGVYPPDYQQQRPLREVRSPPCVAAPIQPRVQAQATGPPLHVSSGGGAGCPQSCPRLNLASVAALSGWQSGPLATLCEPEEKRSQAFTGKQVGDVGELWCCPTLRDVEPTAPPPPPSPPQQQQPHLHMPRGRQEGVQRLESFLALAEQQQQQQQGSPLSAEFSRCFNFPEPYAVRAAAHDVSAFDAHAHHHMMPFAFDEMGMRGCEECVNLAQAAQVLRLTEPPPHVGAGYCSNPGAHNDSRVDADITAAMAASAATNLSEYSRAISDQHSRTDMASTPGVSEEALTLIPAVDLEAMLPGVAPASTTQSPPLLPTDPMQKPPLFHLAAICGINGGGGLKAPSGAVLGNGGQSSDGPVTDNDVAGTSTRVRFPPRLGSFATVPLRFQQQQSEVDVEFAWPGPAGRVQAPSSVACVLAPPFNTDAVATGGGTATVAMNNVLLNAGDSTLAAAPQPPHVQSPFNVRWQLPQLPQLLLAAPSRGGEKDAVENVDFLDGLWVGVDGGGGCILRPPGTLSPFSLPPLPHQRVGEASSENVPGEGGAGGTKTNGPSPVVSTELLMISPVEADTLSQAFMFYGLLASGGGGSGNLTQALLRTESSCTELRSWDSFTEAAAAVSTVLPAAAGVPTATPRSYSMIAASASVSPRVSLQLYSKAEPQQRSSGNSTSLSIASASAAALLEAGIVVGSGDGSGSSSGSSGSGYTSTADAASPHSGGGEAHPLLHRDLTCLSAAPDNGGSHPVPLTHEGALGERGVGPSFALSTCAATAGGTPTQRSPSPSPSEVEGAGVRLLAPPMPAHAIDAVETSISSLRTGVETVGENFGASCTAHPTADAEVFQPRGAADTAAPAGSPMTCWPALAAAAATSATSDSVPALLHSRMLQLGFRLLAFSVHRGWLHTTQELLAGLARLGMSLADAEAAVASQNDGMGLLHLAVISQNLPLLRALLAATGVPSGSGGSAGCDAVREAFAWDVAAPGHGGLTPLHLATALDDGGVVALGLLEAFPDAPALWFTATCARGVTPAEMAAKSHQGGLNDWARAQLAEGEGRRQQQEAEVLQQHPLVLPQLLVEQQQRQQTELQRRREAMAERSQQWQSSPHLTDAARANKGPGEGDNTSDERQGDHSDGTSPAVTSFASQTAATRYLSLWTGQPALWMAALARLLRPSLTQPPRTASWLKESLIGFADPQVEARYRQHRAASLSAVDTTCGFVFSCFFVLPALELVLQRRGGELVSHCVFNLGLLGPYLLHATAPKVFRCHRDATLVTGDVFKVLLVLLALLGVLPLPQVWSDFARGHMDVLMLVIIKPLSEQIHMGAAVLQRAAAVLSDTYIYNSVLYGGALVPAVARAVLQNAAALALLLLLDVHARWSFVQAETAGHTPTAASTLRKAIPVAAAASDLKTLANTKTAS